MKNLKSNASVHRTVLQAVTAKLVTRKRGMTAPELARATGRLQKSVHNRLGEMVAAGTAGWEEYTGKCKVTGNFVTKYTKA